MRVTQSMLSSNTLRNLSSSYMKLGKYQDQLSSQKKINRPSDDPVVAFKGIGYRSSLNEVEQYKRNLGEVNNWLENTEDALDKTNSAVQRVSELVVQANNQTLTDNDRGQIEKEIEELKKQIISVANTKVAGKYIFNGSDIYTEPVQYDQTTGNISKVFGNDLVKIEVSAGVNLTVNTDGTTIFDQLLTDIEGLQGDLNTTEPDLGNRITQLQNHLENINSARSSIGATMNRVELIGQRLDSTEIIATKMVSENEDVDIEKVIMNLKTQESIHQAALSAGARIMQPTLMDFLR